MSQTAAAVAIGDSLVVLGPNAEYDDAHGGLEFRPTQDHAGPAVVVGDAPAVPAVLSVLTQLPADAFGDAILEVPDESDIADVKVPVGFRVTRLVQRGSTSRVFAAVDEAMRRLGLGKGDGDDAPLLEADDDEPLWDVPEESSKSGLYAWIAGSPPI